MDHHGDLRRLIDEAAIARLIARCCQLIDARDALRIAEQIFTEEAFDDHGIYGKPAEGRAGIEEIYVRSNRTTDGALTYVTGWTWLHESAGAGKLRPAD